ncbi:hypothetical protein PENSPDRAFT_654661 [Peniophora sp. CONT]|nr:hypothetical protein PENSPDRAFT_654661 [Peniophora sp. CONT]
MPTFVSCFEYAAMWRGFLDLEAREDVTSRAFLFTDLTMGYLFGPASEPEQSRSRAVPLLPFYSAAIFRSSRIGALRSKLHGRSSAFSTA